MKLSLVIPVYNGEVYLAELLDSVLSQTYADWECLCVDDGGTDGSLAILKDYAARDSRFKILSKANGGTGDSRNAGARQAEGDYVLFADQDDLLHPKLFAQVARAVSACPCDVLTFDYCQFADSKTLRFAPCASVPPRFLGVSDRKPYPANVEADIIVWRHAFRRTVFKSQVFLPISGGEDYAFMAHLLFTDMTWAHVPLVLYANRRNPRSCSRGASLRYIRDVFTGYGEVGCLTQSSGETAEAWAHQLVNAVFWFSLSIVARSRQTPNPTETLDCLRDCLSDLVNRGFINLKRGGWRAWLLNRILSHHYALLRAMSVFCAPLLFRK